MKNFIILLLIGVCVYLFLFRKKETVVEKIPPEVTRTVELESDRINKKIDEEGIEHAVVSELENTINKYKELHDSARIEIDSITDLLGIKQAQLNSYISYSTTLKDSLLYITSKTDTSYTFKDKSAVIEFVEPGKYFNFSYDAKINYATYSERRWFLGKKKDYIDFWIADKRATINGVKKLKIEAPDRFFKVDLNAAAYYTDKLHTGFDGGLNFGRLRLGAGYLYDTSVKEWRPVFTAKYKLIDF